MVIGVMGASGEGKTTSLRNLDPKTTFIIDSDKKGLTWKGWKDMYSSDNKNYVKTDLAQTALAYLQNGESFTSEDGLHKITHRKSQSVEVTDLSALDERFLRYKEPEPDKKLISQALKEGYKVEGAQLITKLSIQIK